eukprot:1156460-Pelagomonas_calceolata.AAC.3
MRRGKSENICAKVIQEPFKVRREQTGLQEQRNMACFSSWDPPWSHGGTYYIQMCAPAKVRSQLLRCEHVNKSALCFSACTCLIQDANT